MVDLVSVVDLRSEARKYTASALKTLISVMQNPENAPAPRVAAATTILDRGWGKAALQVEQHHNVTLNIASEHVKILKSLADLKRPLTIDAEPTQVLQLDAVNSTSQVANIVTETDDELQSR